MNLFMPTNKVQVKKFVFNAGQDYELPAHWIPFQVIDAHQMIEVWAYRNGNT